jgi:hypothetical protein
MASVLDELSSWRSRQSSIFSTKGVGGVKAQKPMEGMWTSIGLVSPLKGLGARLGAVLPTRLYRATGSRQL